MKRDEQHGINYCLIADAYAGKRAHAVQMQNAGLHCKSCS